MDPVRRRFVSRLGGSLAVILVAATPAKVMGAIGSGPRRIAWVHLSRKDADRIRSAFRTRGVAEGRDITLTFADYPSDCEEAKALIARLVRGKPDMIVFASSCAVAYLPPDIPAVFYNMAGDPVRMGLVESLRRPGGHVTGTTLAINDMIPLFWQQLKEAVPGMTRAGIVVQEPDAADREIRRDQGRKDVETEDHHAAGARLGLKIVDVQVSRNATAEEIVATLQKAGVKAAYFEMQMAPAMIQNLAVLLKSSRIASMTYSFHAARKGFLLGWSFDFNEGESYAVTIVERILRGERPAQIPVYQTRRFEFAFNRTTANALGLPIPSSLVIRASEVVD